MVFQSLSVQIVVQSIKALYPTIITDNPATIDKTMLATIMSSPPSIERGDIAFPMFFLSKIAKKSPKDIAMQFVAHLMEQKELSNESSSSGNSQQKNPIQLLQKAQADGPYVNLFFHRIMLSSLVLQDVEREGKNYGATLCTVAHNYTDDTHSVEHALKGKRIMIEFSAPNTNKPLHIGHLRNDVLGESISRIFAFLGAEVQRVNLVNDRGVHICKSMLSYKMFANGHNPQQAQQKSDHFVGSYYVKYSEWEKNNTNTAEHKINTMLQQWEQNDPDVRALWKQMNTWALDGIFETYKATNIHFDKIYYESETYQLGKHTILEGYKKGLFYKDEKGAIRLSLKEIGLDEKILLRSDGTSVYITQDVGTAMQRYEDWDFDSIIYVVANEQIYHFKVLFYLLKILQFPPALKNTMHHLHYGMVHLPEGKMKSREGTVVDADDLIATVSSLIKEEIYKRERNDEFEDLDAVVHNIALGAIHYYLLHINAKKDLVFNPQSSISFQGNTGPYLQYTCARIASLLRKYSSHKNKTEEDIEKTITENFQTLYQEYDMQDDEWKLIIKMDNFANIIQQVIEKYDASILAKYVYELASDFASYYHSIPIVKEHNFNIQALRLRICKSLLQIMKNTLHLLVIPYVDKM